MIDKPTYEDRVRSTAKEDVKPEHRLKAEADESEDTCRAFGYLRGIRDHANAVEFRFRDGNSVWFPYTWLGPCRYDPSEGLLLKFSGDLVYLVLIRGSNLDRPLNKGAVNLTHAGLQRHRLLWLREMSPEEARQVGENGPTIDSIEIAEFESNADATSWLSKHAPAFLQT